MLKRVRKTHTSQLSIGFMSTCTHKSKQACIALLTYRQGVCLESNRPGLIPALPVGLLFVGCSMSQQHAIVSQGWICSDNCTSCHTEIKVADQIFHLIQSQYTDTGPTTPSTDSKTPGTWQSSHWSTNF